MWIDFFFNWICSVLAAKNYIHTRIVFVVIIVFIVRVFGFFVFLSYRKIYFFFGFFTESAFGDLLSAFVLLLLFVCCSKFNMASTTYSKKNPPDIFISFNYFLRFQNELNFWFKSFAYIFFNINNLLQMFFPVHFWVLFYFSISCYLKTRAQPMWRSKCFSYYFFFAIYLW